VVVADRAIDGEEAGAFPTLGGFAFSARYFTAAGTSRFHVEAP
jgi:hypothetical protein